MLNSLATFIWKQEAQKVLLQAKILGVSNSIRNEDNSFFWNDRNQKSICMLWAGQGIIECWS